MSTFFPQENVAVCCVATIVKYQFTTAFRKHHKFIFSGVYISSMSFLINQNFITFNYFDFISAPCRSQSPKRSCTFVPNWIHATHITSKILIATLSNCKRLWRTVMQDATNEKHFIGAEYKLTDAAYTIHDIACGSENQMVHQTQRATPCLTDRTRRESSTQLRGKKLGMNRR